MKMVMFEASSREVSAMYSAILEGKAATWFRATCTRSWFAAVLILVLCALALSACGSGDNGGGEAGGNATGEGS